MRAQELLSQSLCYRIPKRTSIAVSTNAETKGAENPEPTRPFSCLSNRNTVIDPTSSRASPKSGRGIGPEGVCARLSVYWNVTVERPARIPPGTGEETTRASFCNVAIRVFINQPHIFGGNVIPNTAIAFPPHSCPTETFPSRQRSGICRFVFPSKINTILPPPTFRTLRVFVSSLCISAFVRGLFSTYFGGVTFSFFYVAFVKVLSFHFETRAPSTPRTHTPKKLEVGCSPEENGT